MSRLKIRTLERFSATMGTLLCAIFFVVACAAKEMSTKDAVLFAVLAGGLGYGWSQLRNSN
jgi:hypothetical protein